MCRKAEIAERNALMRVCGAYASPEGYLDKALEAESIGRKSISPGVQALCKERAARYLRCAELVEKYGWAGE